MDRIVPAVVIVLVLMLMGCATPIDWNARIGSYTYDQAVTDLGTPAVTDQTSDRMVATWMIRSQHVVVTPAPAPVMYGPDSYAPRGIGYDGPGGYSTTHFPAEFLRLEFDANGHLKAWKKYSN